MEDKKFTVNIATITILKVVMIGILLWFLFEIREVLMLLLISIIISSAMEPVAASLSRYRIPRALSVLLVYGVFIGLLVLAAMMLAPSINQQFFAISQGDFYDQFQSKLGVFRDLLNQSGFGQTIQNNIQNWTGSFSSSLFSTTKGVFNGVLSVVTVIAVSFYLTVEENGMKNLVTNLTPFKHQAYVGRLIGKIQKKIGYWVLGQVILSAVIFGFTYIGLTILKVKFALFLALIAGLFEIIPIIGPIISAIPAVFFAFLQNPPLALAVVALYVIIQQLENHIIVPVVMSKSVGLNPVLVILGILVGGTIGGIVGGVIAVPVLSGISVFISDFMRGKEEADEAA